MSKKEGSPNQARTVAIIPAAGAGIRMGGDRAKQFLDLDGKPLLAVTLQTFEFCKAVDSVIPVVPLTDIEYCRREIVKRYNLKKVYKLVPGGKRRQDSVRLGINATGGKFDIVLIHDGVRPVISVSFIQRLIEAAMTHRAVIPGLPIKETVKEVDSRRDVVKTYNRGQVWLSQTPQVFRYEDIRRAHQMSFQWHIEDAPDDSFLIEKMGVPVKVIDGSEKNIKVTTPYDLELARFLINPNVA